MLFVARTLVLLLFCSSALALLSTGYLPWKLPQTTLPSEKKGPFRAPKTSSSASFDFERLLAGFYVSAEEEVSPEAPEALSVEAPELRAIYFGKKLKLALLKAGEESRWLKEGERLKGWRLARISPDSVTLVFKDRRVVRKLFESEKRASQGPSPETTSSAKPFIIAREELERLTSDIGSLFSQIRLRPYFHGGQMEGVLTEYVAPGSLFSRAGLRAGDIILSINGIPVRKNEDAFRILEVVKTASSVAVKIRRAGKILTLKAEVR